MLKRLLNSLLLVTLALASKNKDVQEDLVGILQLALNTTNNTIGTFYPNKTAIGENELKLLETSLDKLDSGSRPRQKRQADNSLIYMDDEIAALSNKEQSEDKNMNYEVKSSLNNVEIPTKGSSPAFSIHADKVYILYPSLFQDPNIFGRFSIPQNINLDPLPDKTITKNSETPSSNKMPNDIPNNVYSPSYQPQGRKMYRRQAPNSAPPTQKPPSKREEKKRNVETHLSGTIVVLNQDVNEFNRKETY